MNGKPYLSAVGSWLAVLCFLSVVLLGLRLILPTLWGVLASATGVGTGPISAFMRIASYVAIVITLVSVVAIVLQTKSGSRFRKWFVEVNQATFWRK